MSTTQLTSPVLTPGRFGKYGGRYVPETLMAALLELEHDYAEAQKDEAFQAELASLLHDYGGRPTPLYFAKRLTENLGGAKIYLKREDLLHTGAHKINNALGQALLARRMGKQRIIAETGAGQHGVATATVCALLRPRVRRLHGRSGHGAPGAERLPHAAARRRGPRRRRPAPTRSRTPSTRPCATGSPTSATPIYILGSRARRASLSDHGARLPPRHQRRDPKRQILEHEGRLPDAIVACVGGGSNAIGAFYEFIPEPNVELIGVEAGGRGSCPRRARCAVRWRRCPACCRAPIATSSRTTTARSRRRTPSPPASTTPPSAPSTPCCTTLVARDTPRPPTPKPSKPRRLLSRTEGIIPALESAHAIAEAIKLAPKMGKDKILMVNVTGRGDKDMGILTKELAL